MASLAKRDLHSALASARRVVTSIPATIFAFFTVFYALTSAGRLDSADGQVVAQGSIALLHGRLAIPSYVGEAIVGTHGLYYSKYGIGQSIVEIPFVAVGVVLRSLSKQPALLSWGIAFTNTFVTALTCAIFYVLLRALGATKTRAVALTFIFGICTLAWPYAKSDLSEPLQSLCLLGATLAVVEWRLRNELRWLFLSGFLLGWLILTKPALAVVAPGFFLYLIVPSLLVENRFSLSPLRTRVWWIQTLKTQASLWTPVIVAGIITIVLNVAKFGSPLDFGYGRDPHDSVFSGSLLTGGFGLLLSFNSGIIFFAAPILLGVLGYKRFFQRHLPEMVLIGVASLAVFLLYGTFYYWGGLAAFGPRYLLPIVPLLLLPAVEADLGMHGGKVTRRGLFVAVCVIVGIGFIVELSGVLVSFTTYTALTCDKFPCASTLDPTQSELLYNVWLAPSVVALNFAGTTPHIALADYPFGAAPTGRPGWSGLLIDRMYYFWFEEIPNSRLASIIGLIIGATLLFFLGRRLRRMIASSPSTTASAPRQMAQAQVRTT